MITIEVSNSRASRDEIARYLPSNYRMTQWVTENGDYIVQGDDHAGWTAEAYVIPRLQSGWISAKVVDWDPVELRDCPHFD